MESVLVPPFLVNQRNHYTKYIYYNTPSDWVVHISMSGYMYQDEWPKSMLHFYYICGSSPLEHQVLFYDGDDIIYFYDKSFNALYSHRILDLVLKAGESAHNQTNDNGPRLKLKNLFCG